MYIKNNVLFKYLTTPGQYMLIYNVLYNRFKQQTRKIDHQPKQWIERFETHPKNEYWRTFPKEQTPFGYWTCFLGWE